MPGWARTVLPLLLLGVVCRPTGATPSWDDPVFTADTMDKFIKDFDESNAVVSIYEDVPIGHMIGVLHINAQPGDTVTVTQTDTNDILLSFDGNNTEQNMYIQSALDYEKTDTINTGLQLNGGSTYYITIQIVDVNENPTFDGVERSQISLVVPENQLNDSLLILTATAGDVDATANLTYSLSTAGYDDLFSLKPLIKDDKPACQLQMLEELDYETRPVYRLRITVTTAPDERGITLSTSVTVFVNVEDASDTAPIWLLPPTANCMDEGAVQGSELFIVEAIAGDARNINNSIIYSIVSQDPKGIAEIIDDTTGSVTLTKTLDREDPELTDGVITLVIKAREVNELHPHQTCTNITCVTGKATVIVNDLDDNQPKFEQASYSVNFPENTTDSIDLLITVNDLDPMPANNMVSLSLAGAPTGVFGLRRDRGPTPLTTFIQVKDRDYMDYEKEDHRVIQLQIEATSDNPAQLPTYTYVTINLTDIDD